MNRIRKIINQFIFTRWSEKFSATKYMRLVSSTEKSKYRQLYYWHQLIYFRKNHLTFPCTTGFDQRVQKVNMSRCSILTRSELLLLLLVFMEVRIACSSVLPRLFDVHHSSNTCFIQHRKCNIYFHFWKQSEVIFGQYGRHIGKLSDQRHSNNIFCILTNISVLFGLIWSILVLKKFRVVRWRPNNGNSTPKGQVSKKKTELEAQVSLYQSSGTRPEEMILENFADQKHFFQVMVILNIQSAPNINFERKLSAHERNNFIFHVNMHFCNIVLFHKCRLRYWALSTQRIILYKHYAILSSNEQKC
jgi:hypothetical protein